MEKAWKNFWLSGKVTDYLSYCEAINDELKKEEQEQYVTISCIDGDGTDIHAH